MRSVRNAPGLRNDYVQNLTMLNEITTEAGIYASAKGNMKSMRNTVGGEIAIEADCHHRGLTPVIDDHKPRPSGCPV